MFCLPAFHDAQTNRLHAIKAVLVATLG